MRDNRKIALEILGRPDPGLTWRAAQFLGQVAGLPDHPLTEKQATWFAQIVERAGGGHD